MASELERIKAAAREVFGNKPVNALLPESAEHQRYYIAGLSRVEKADVDKLAELSGLRVVDWDIEIDSSTGFDFELGVRVVRDGA